MPYNFFKNYLFLCATIGVIPHPQLDKIPSYYEKDVGQHQNEDI